VSAEEFLAGFFQIEEDIFFCMPLEIDDSTSYVETLASPHHKDWNEVGELVDLSPRCKTIGNKWVFKVKTSGGWIT